MYFLHGRIVVNMSLFKDCDSFVDQKSKMATIVTQSLEYNRTKYWVNIFFSSKSTPSKPNCT